MTTEPGAAARAGWRASCRLNHRRDQTGAGLQISPPNHPSLAEDGGAVAGVAAARNRVSLLRARSSSNAHRDPVELGDNGLDGGISSAALPVRPVRPPAETARRRLRRRASQDSRAAKVTADSTAGAAAAVEAAAVDRSPAADRTRRAGPAVHPRVARPQADARPAEFAGIEWASRAFA